MEPELDVIGRHAMLFDDDANASFVNSKDALVEWNSLFIDRYDVRHLLTNPPASFRNLRHGSSSSSSSSLPPDSDLESELDLERYADLPSSSDEPEVENEMDAHSAGGYHTVAFSYGNTVDSTDHKNHDEAQDISAFHPPFSVPESLLQNLPPTEKVHQIIARTAMFVGEHGGQSEIVLRVKQGDNPTFGFLMPHHHLHPYFRYLVDHLELLKADNDGKLQEEKSLGNQTGGALSLLGSVYGSGEDEDGIAEANTETKQTDSRETSPAEDMSKCHQLEEMVTSGIVAQRDDMIPKHKNPSKEKATVLSKNRVHSVKPGHGSGPTVPNLDKPKASSLFPISKVESSLVDPPSEVKRLVDRIVEIILKNGKDFEAVLIEQDKKQERFPFLLPSNQYHPYYLKVLKKAQESRLNGKSFSSEKTTSSKENDFASSGSRADDLSVDYDKKEKFKMVISNPKKESQDQPSKESQQQCGVRVDAAAAAAILQAATRGIKKPNLDIFSRTSLNEGESSEPQSSAQKQDRNGLKPKPSGVTVPIAKEIAKTAALVAASEADSSEAGLTREKKLKAERLRRAKMFAAMIKSGVKPSGVSSPATEVNGETKDREGSSVKPSDDESERKSRKSRRYRSRKHDDSEGEEEEDEGKREEEDDHGRHSRKKYKSHRDRSKDRHKHRRRHSSSKSRETRHHHRHESSSEEEKDNDSHHRHTHDGSSTEDEHKHHKRRHKRDISSEDEHKHKRKHKRSRKDEERHKRKSKRKSHIEQGELEEGEIISKSTDQSPSTSSYQEKRTPSLPPSETTEVPDELRAKIRAMLLATM